MLLNTISRCSNKKYIQRRLLSQALATLDTELIKPPSSVNSVSTGSPTGACDEGVSFREVGCTRRVFVMKTHLSAEEIEGMAYRIKVLSRNKGISSVLITRLDDTVALPSSVTENENYNHGNDDTFSIIQGYDPIELYKSGLYKDESNLNYLFESLGSLTEAVRGDAKGSRIPILTLPSGIIYDSGYALCMGGYVLATEDTSFQIVNPSRGLSFDPIGLSFILPRLGWEYQQRSADFVGCGIILALTGMKANAADMMETGLSTHYIESSTKLGMLERSLADLPPWDQQSLYKDPPRFYGQPERENDVNAEHRNVPVANLVYCFSSYNNSSDNLFISDDFDSMMEDDPSINLDYISFDETRKSYLLQYAKMFDSVFREENTVAGILERLKEVSNRDSIDEEVKGDIAIAKKLVLQLEQQSPLAISVIYKLMKLGAQKGQSMASCMEREKRSQVRLFQMDDFQKWATYKTSSRGNHSFSDWKYKQLTEVPADEVDDIIGS